MRRPGACPGWGATWLLHAVPKGSRCHQDKHQAPTLPHIRPLSLQDPIRSSQFIRGEGGWVDVGESLYGRPRPVPCAHLWGNAIIPPAPGDHKGPPFPTSSALAPTDVDELSARLTPIGRPLWLPKGDNHSRHNCYNRYNRYKCYKCYKTEGDRQE